MSSQPQSLPDAGPVAFVQQHGASLLDEAAQLRAFEMPPDNAGPYIWDEALRQIRARLDRLEELRVRALTMRSTIRAGTTAQVSAADEAWARAAEGERRSGRAPREFEGAKERAARFDLASIGEKRTARQWEQAREMADTVAEQVRLMHSGLDAARSDIHAHLRFMAWESSLDRT